MRKYTDKGTARQHLTDRLMESALNNFGIKADADEVFRDIAENRLPVWMDELQTAEVQEVRHGRWIEDYDGIDTFYECSVCGEPFVTLEGTPADNLWNYCPNCGALMVNEDD